MPNYKQLGKADKVSPGIFRADAPVQSFQTKYRKFKYKVGKGIRNFLGEEEPTIKKPSQ